MVKKGFDVWLSKLRASILGYRYYIDFDKVVRDMEDVKIKLNILNLLIGSVNIEGDFEKTITKYPETLSCIPLPLAMRSSETYAQDENGAFKYNFRAVNYDMGQCKIFMRKTGSFDLPQKHLVNNLVNYALRIGAGLDSNGRKNRGGHQIEDLMEQYIIAVGLTRDENYFKETYPKDTENKWDTDLSTLSNEGKVIKRFDFVVRTEFMTYAVETSFYGSRGPELNETARSYKMFSQEMDTIERFSFVQFIDDIGWKNARGNLRETFEVMEHVYNTDDMKHSVMTVLLA